MTDKTPRTGYKRSRRGSLNRSSVTVRLALFNQDFDGIVEWVKSFKQLEILLQNTPDSEKLPIIRTKFEKLEKLFEHVYPKIKETELISEDLIEMEQEVSGTVAIEDKTTEQLLAEVKNV